MPEMPQLQWSHAVIVPSFCTAALIDWIDVRGTEEGPLLPPVLKGGRIQHGRRMSPQGVYERLRRLGDAAGVQQFSPHDLRRTFVGDLLDAGADIVTVQALAALSRRARDVDDAARAALLHVDHRAARNVERSAQVRGQHLGPLAV